MDTPVFGRTGVSQIQKMTAVGQKNRETVVAASLGHVGGNATDPRDPLDRTPGVTGGREHDHVSRFPGLSPGVARQGDDAARGTSSTARMFRIAIVMFSLSPGLISPSTQARHARHGPRRRDRNGVRMLDAD